MRGTLLLFGLLATTLAGCGDDDDDSCSDAECGGEGEGEGEATVEVVFDLTSRAQGGGPWPSDLYRDDDGHVRPTALVLSGELNDSMATSLDGFGRTTPLTVWLSGDVDVDTAATAAWLVDPRDGTRIPLTAQFRAATGVLSFRMPVGTIRDEATTYAFGVTQDLLDTQGNPVTPSEDFLLLREMAERPTDADEQKAWDVVEPAIEALEGAGAAREQLVIAATFTTQETTAVLESMVAAARATDSAAVVTQAVPEQELDDWLGVAIEPLPGIDNPGDPEASAPAHDHISYMIHGTFTAPYFLSETPGGHGQVVVGEDGTAQVRSEDDVPFTLVLPASVPLDDLRVVIIQHGVGAERSMILGVANTLCARGFAVIGIDAPFHGLRAAGADNVNNFTEAEVPDLFGDSSGRPIVLSFVGALVINADLPVMHPFFLRDGMRQTTSDLVALTHLLRTGDWSAVRAADPGLAELGFSPEPLGFIGNSLGSIIGTIFLSVEPEVTAGVLSVGGGDILTLVQDSPPFNEGYFPVFMPLISMTLTDFDYDTYSPAYDPLFGVWETILEAGDSFAWAQRLAASPTHVLLPFAVDDETLSNTATETLLVALDMPMVQTEYEPRYGEIAAAAPYPIESEGGAPVRLAVPYSPASHGLLVSRQDDSSFVAPVLPPFEHRDEPVDIQNPIDAAQEQAASFLESAMNGGAVISAP